MRSIPREELIDMDGWSLVRRGLGVLCAAALLVGAALPGAASQGRQGLQGGWAIDNAGHVNFYHSLVSEMPYMVQASAGAIRINFRLGDCFSNWTSRGCATADGSSAM